MAPRRETFFASCPPGYERVLLAECRALKLVKPEAQYGGVRFFGTREHAIRANLWLRTASRVLLHLARFPAKTKDELYDGVRNVKWGRFVDPDGTLAVSARGKNEGLANSHFVERRVKDAIVDQFRDETGKRPSVDLEDPQLIVNCRVSGDRATVLADMSGLPLFKRGWRVAPGSAPLKETLAAFIVLSADWDRRSPLLDPFCGSGTILVEAGLIAGNVAPGLFRERFGFERWPDHRAGPVAKLREEARAAATPPKKLVLRGSDRDG
ncbi:MAG: THUMP domain-containing protein, partial [Planctomycetota bacterium]